MANTHYYHLVGDSHTRGSRGADVGARDPVILGPSEFMLELIDLTAGMGTLAVNDILEQIVLGVDMRARVIKVLDNNTIQATVICEPVASDATSNLYPTTSAGDPAYAWDTYGLMNRNGVTGATQIARVVPGKTVEQLNDQRLTAVSDQTVFYDEQAKRAQWIDIDNYTDTPSTDYLQPGDQVSNGSGVTFIVVGLKVDHGGPNTARLYIARVAGGSLSVSDPLTNDQVNRALLSATITAIGPATTTGEWVPYCAIPSLNRSIDGEQNDYLTNEWEVPPRGNAGSQNAGLGPDVNIVRNAVAMHEQYPAGDQGVRLLTMSSNDESQGYGFRSGVSMQEVQVTGYSGTWSPGDVITAGASGWTAKFAATDGVDRIFVHATNGQTLGSGETLTAASGGTATSTGPAYGWRKGSKFWNDWVARRATAAAADGALEGGAAEEAAGFFSMIWEGELAPFGQAGAGGFLLIAYCLQFQDEIREEWVQWINDVRVELGSPSLPVSMWIHHSEAQSEVGIAGGLAPGIVTRYVRSLIQSIPEYVGNVTVVDSELRGHQMGSSDAGEAEFYLRTLDYVDLGNAFWNLLLEPTLNAPEADFKILPVLVIAGSQSQMVGFNRYDGQWALANRDPDLWPTAAFQTANGTIDTRDPNVLSWNFATRELEIYDCAQNENTFWNAASTNGTSGPLPPLVQRLKMRFGDGTNSAPIAFFKAALGGSCYNPDPSIAAAGCWSPSLVARNTIVASITITHEVVGALTYARLTAAPGTFSQLVNNNIITIDGSSGQQSAGGNNSNEFTYNQVVTTLSPDGAFVDILDNSSTIFQDGTETLTISIGPPPVWPEMVSQWKAFIQKCVARGYVPHPVAVVTEQGESDMVNADEYAAQLDELWDALLELVSLRGKKDIGIAKCLVQMHRDTPFSTDPEPIETIRNAQAAKAASLPDCVLVDSSGLAFESSDFGVVLGSPPFPRKFRLENGIHHSGLSMITKGYLIDQALGTLSSLIPPHPRGDVELFAAVNNGASLEIGESEGTEDVGALLTGGEESPAAASAASPTISASGSQDIIASIDTAIAGGADVASYTVNGRTVTLRSLGELIKARRYFEAQKARANNLRYTKASFTR